MKSTQAMRDRCRELSNADDYDRAVVCIIDDLEELLSVPAQQKLEPDDLTDALLHVIDGWRKTHPDLSYYETVTVIEGIGRLLHNLRNAAFPSTSSATPTYCALCDHEHQLHEDAKGFHHVIKGERVACPEGGSTHTSTERGAG